MEKYRLKTKDKEVNLDSPKFWKEREEGHRKIFENIQPWAHFKTTYQLHEWAYSILGMSLYYMQYVHPDIDWGDQKKRIDKMCKQYEKQSAQYYKDTKANRLWIRKFIFKLLDETENMC
jgi:hypothetical protein